MSVDAASPYMAMPINATAAAMSVMPSFLCMKSPGVLRLEALMIPRPRGSDYFWDRIHFTSALASPSGTEALGGIGT